LDSELARLRVKREREAENTRSYEEAQKNEAEERQRKEDTEVKVE
jgi:hypothetical protein